MPSTIIVDPDGSTQSGEQLPPPADFKPKTILEHLAEPLDPNSECYVVDGRPCLLFGDWDYAEDWSGEYLKEVHPFTVMLGTKVSEAEWRSLLEHA